MSGLILPSTYYSVEPIGRGQDVNDITRSVQDGDPTVGWRGDPSMDVYREGSEVKVYSFDARGQRYVAATVNLADSDWRRTLLIKLKEGDWQNPVAYDKLIERQEKADRDRQTQAEDQAEEVKDKMVHAILKDFGHKRIF